MNELFDVRRYIEFIANEIGLVVNTLRDRGAQRFGRALATAGILFAGSYMLVYKPAIAKSDRLEGEITRAKTLYDNAQRYQEQRDMLQGAYARLPSDKDRAQWLFNSVHESLDKSGIVTDNIKSVQEQELNGLVFQSIGVVIDVRFPEFYDWLLRIENARPTMHLEQVDIARKTGSDEAIGYNSTTCSIGTVIPKKRYQ